MSLFVTKAIDAVPIIAHATPIPIATARPEDWVLLSSWVWKGNKWSWSYHFLECKTRIPNWELVSAISSLRVGVFASAHDAMPRGCLTPEHVLQGEHGSKVAGIISLAKLTKFIPPPPPPSPPWQGLNTRLRGCCRQQFPERGRGSPHPRALEFLLSLLTLLPRRLNRV